MINVSHIRSGPWAHLDFHKHLDDFIANVLLSVPNELCFWLTTPPSRALLVLLLLLLSIHFHCSCRRNQQQGDDDRWFGPTKLPFQIQRAQFRQGLLTFFPCLLILIYYIFPNRSPYIYSTFQIASQKFRDRGCQVIDLYYSLQSQIAQRNNDGIHWSPQANR